MRGATDRGGAVRSCEHCVHAAFDQGGVYCKLFGESILQPVAVAEECGEFELDSLFAEPSDEIRRG